MQTALTRLAGGSFLIEDLTPDQIFTPEDFTFEQRQIAQLATDFAEENILTQIPAIEAKDFALTRRLMRELGELGLLGVDVAELYGGLELDKVTSALIAQSVSVLGSFAVTFSAHNGIGTLPLAWYGTPAQKAAYLPSLVSGEMIAAYALSESSAGSDAMNIRTKATLSPDGTQYILNGEKMWISNAGFADLFTVFAKIVTPDAELFSAFLIPAGTPGLSIGAEEHKLGIRGSSTCALTLTDCAIPVDNLLGTAGKGHQIAFNILNVGRYKLAANAIGSAKQAFRDGVRYASDRVAFGKPITQFGLVQQKIAACAANLYALESTLYRVVGAIDEALTPLDKSSPTYTAQVQKCIEEFASECSILKFAGSEILDRIVDHVLQLHGGYGYVEDFPAERHYRDSRINRIFEGTNEINRLITASWMLKRAQAGAIPLLDVIRRNTEDLNAGRLPQPDGRGPLAPQQALLAQAKQLTLLCTGAAWQHFGKQLVDQQEVLGALAEMMAEVLLLESTLVRTEKMRGSNALAIACTQYYAVQAFATIQSGAQRILPNVAQGDDLRGHMNLYRSLTQHDPVDLICLGRQISDAMAQAGRYTIEARINA